MEEITDEPAELMERVAALGIGKAALTACVRYRTRASPEPACGRSATARRPPGHCWDYGTGSCDHLPEIIEILATIPA